MAPIRETPVALVRRARKVYRVLQETYPDAHCELDFATPLQLLVATMLSAQCTDVRVNQVTPALFRAYPTAGGVSISPYDTNTDSQLFSRSVWNTRWVLFIPAASLGSDQNATMQRFIDTVTDVQLKLVTFSSSGM